MRFRIAVCQFPLSGSIRANGQAIAGLIAEAAARKALVAQFPECALSGYAGTHHIGWDGFDWVGLREEAQRIMALARHHRMWLILGSAHRLAGGNLPHNCLYAVSPAGEIADRYDKLFCNSEDLKHYSPGSHFPVFEIEGVRCGLLICHDARYPELYREYRRRGVDCLFQSFFNARTSGANLLTEVMRPTLQAHAACNHMWISVSNASDYYQSWSSCFIYPDGRIAASLRRHRRGVLVKELDTQAAYEDRCEFRDVAMKGVLHSGTLVHDRRSQQRRQL